MSWAGLSRSTSSPPPSTSRPSMMLGQVRAEVVGGAVLVIVVMTVLSVDVVRCWMESGPAIARLALLGERCESFGRVVGEGRSGGADLLHRLVGVAGIDRLFGHLYRDRGSLGDLERQGAGSVDHVCLGCELVGDPPGQGPLRGQRLAGEDQLLGPTSAHEIAQTPCAAPAWEGANANLGQAKRGVGGDDSQVAGKSELEPAAVRVPGHSGDRGLPEPGKVIEHPVPPAGPLRPHVQRL